MFTNEHLLAQLTDLAGSIRLPASGIVFRGKTYATTDQTRLAALTNLLYSQCYALKQRHQPGESLPPEKALNTDTDFIETLRAHNYSSERVEPGWQLLRLISAEHAEVKRNQDIRTVPVSFIRKPAEAPSLAAGQAVAVYFPREEITPGPSFYYAFGNRPVSSTQKLLRVYWNITHTGAAPLLAWITRQFNRYHIPFIFKCLNHPHLYSRRDAAVLYLEEQAGDFISMLLPECCRAMGEYLHEDVPLFTHAYRPGVGIAESPGVYESFGMHRMKLVAEAILANPDLPGAPETLVKAIARSFIQNGINPEKPFLNNGSQTLVIS